MTGIPTVPMIYLDTNGILSLKEYHDRAAGMIGTPYRRRAQQYEALLKLCSTKNFRVATLSFTLAEMLDKYQQWRYYEKKVAERALYDEIFGRSSKELYYKSLTSTDLLDVASQMDTWLSTSPFRGLVELYPLNDPTRFDSWSVGFWEITRIIYKYVAISAPDCLHAAASVVIGADCFVSSDGGLRRAVDTLYNHPDFKTDAGAVLYSKASDIELKHGALNVQPALSVLQRL
jgi:hypothetical protein